MSETSNKPLKRAGLGTVPGCGRGDVVLDQVLRASVLTPLGPAAQRY